MGKEVGMKTLKKPSAQEMLKALCLISNLANYGELETLDPSGKASEAARLFGEIYKTAHTVLSPVCRKNHPDWYREFQRATRGME